MILCGERIDAETAQRIGLVQDVAAKGEALTRALAWAEGVSRQSPQSVAACKRLIQSARVTAPAVALAHEREAFVDLFDGADQQEGVQAFFGKRAPQWKSD
jgi:enoyl-CoA hydratase/carnithine racemase